MNKAIFVLLVALLGLGLFWYFGREEGSISTISNDVTAGFENFAAVDVDQVTKLTIQKGKSDPIALEKSDTGWVVASSWGYPADEKAVDDLLASLDKIDSPQVAGRSEESHGEFGVDKRKGGFIHLYGKDGAELARLVVGDSAKNTTASLKGGQEVLVRFGDEAITYRVASDIRSKANLWSEKLEAKRFLEKKLVEIGTDEEVRSVRLVRPDEQDVLVERRYRVKPGTEKSDSDDAEDAKDADEEPKDGEKKDEEKKEPEKEEYFVVTSGSETFEADSEKWKARSLLDRGKSFSIDDVADPAGTDYGLDTPALKAVVTYAKKGDEAAVPKTYTIVFGNAYKNEEGKDDGYYVALEGAGHDGKVYKIGKWSFDGWSKKVPDFQAPPPKPEEKNDAAGTSGGSAPAEGGGAAADSGGAAASSEPPVGADTVAPPGSVNAEEAGAPAGDASGEETPAGDASGEETPASGGSVDGGAPPEEPEEGGSTAKELPVTEPSGSDG